MQEKRHKKVQAPLCKGGSRRQLAGDCFSNNPTVSFADTSPCTGEALVKEGPYVGEAQETQALLHRGGYGERGSLYREA